MTRTKGLKSRSRKLLTKGARERGLPSPTKLLRSFSVGEKVVIKIEPSVHKGLPHRRFQGKVGVIKEKRGKGYVVEVPMKPIAHLITVKPAHLAPLSRGDS